jgi:hypothetical protein
MEREWNPVLKLHTKHLCVICIPHIAGDPTPPTQTTWVGGENMVYI